MKVKNLLKKLFFYEETLPERQFTLQEPDSKKTEKVQKDKKEREQKIPVSTDLDKNEEYVKKRL